jgi:tetrathionate reductase subunit B
VQTCLAGARIFGDLNDPKSAVAGYVNKGAIKMESDAVRIGPNVRYFGNRRDIDLLQSSCTPQVMPEASLRRIMLAKLVKPIIREARKKMTLFDFS